MIFRQLIEEKSHTFTYILAEGFGKPGLIIDPVLDTVERDLRIIQELGIALKYSLETHVHADHITGASEIRKSTGCQIVIGKNSGVKCADVYVKDGDTLEVGNITLRCLETPGHTDGCMSYYAPPRVFTGDALLIRGTGRTDFQQGSAENLFSSIRKKLFTLPDDTTVFPGHEYQGRGSSTIFEEKKFNLRAREGHSLEQFVEIMKALTLDPPKQIETAVPANLRCGQQLPD